jgi:hypothetical protein
LAVFNFKVVNFAQCTASVLSDYWAISAAHCIGTKDKVTAGTIFMIFLGKNEKKWRKEK